MPRMRVSLPLGTRPVALALRALKLGDLLVAVPALHALRREFPEHELVLAVPGWLEPIARLVGGIDTLLPTPGLDEPLPLAARAVDVAANLHGNGPESRAIVDALAARVTIAHGARVPWRDGIHERERWAGLLAGHDIPADPLDLAISAPDVPNPAQGAVVVHVGAFYGARAWPVVRFAEVARALTADGFRVVVTGGSADVPRARDVARLAGLGADDVFAGRADLTEFAAIVAGATAVCTADTGAAHLASAYRTPSVVIFGPAPVEEWGPPPGPHIALTDASLRRGDVFASDPDPALLAVTAEDVIGAVRRVIRRPEAPA